MTAAQPADEQPAAPGPITPVCCTVPGCPWTVHGTPGQYTDARARHLAEHTAEEHAEPMTDQQLADIRQRANDATDGPWWNDGSEIYRGEPGDISRWIGETCNIDDPQRSDANGAFIAHARRDVPVLLAEVATLRARQERDRAELTRRRTEDLNLRGTLAPADGPRRVPMALGESLTPAVEWLLAEVDRLRALVDRATVFEIPRPSGLSLQLRKQGFGDRWAICDRTGRRLGREGRWWYEPEREDLCDDNRFTLAEALPLAEQLAANPAPTTAP